MLFIHVCLQAKLSKGLLPSPAAGWPDEPFRSAFLASLNKMEMPRFTRRHPQLLDPLLKQMLSLIHVCLSNQTLLLLLCNIHAMQGDSHVRCLGTEIKAEY